MDRDELIAFLKDNLKIEVSHPKRDVGYFGRRLEENKQEVEVVIRIGKDIICSDRTDW